MIADHFKDIEKFEADLWKIADNLRANSNLASNEYFMPIMGLIFLRHATNRFYEAKSAIEVDKAAGKMPDRPLVEADFTRRRALDPEDAQGWQTRRGADFRYGGDRGRLSAPRRPTAEGLWPLRGQRP
jgi:type I restriction enzyme M protein